MVAGHKKTPVSIFKNYQRLIRCGLTTVSAVIGKICSGTGGDGYEFVSPAAAHSCVALCKKCTFVHAWACLRICACMFVRLSFRVLRRTAVCVNGHRCCKPCRKLLDNPSRLCHVCNDLRRPAPRPRSTPSWTSSARTAPTCVRPASTASEWDPTARWRATYIVFQSRRVKTTFARLLFSSPIFILLPKTLVMMTLLRPKNAESTVQTCTWRRPATCRRPPCYWEVDSAHRRYLFSYRRHSWWWRTSAQKAQRALSRAATCRRPPCYWEVDTAHRRYWSFCRRHSWWWPPPETPRMEEATYADMVNWDCPQRTSTQRRTPAVETRMNFSVLFHRISSRLKPAFKCVQLRTQWRLARL